MKPLTVILVIGCLFLASSKALAQSAPKVTVTIVVPKKTPSFSDKRLVVMLTHDFPNQDDRGDKAVDRHIDTKFSHVYGKDTIVTITLGDKAKLDRSVQYHVNVSVFNKASQCTHVGSIDGEPGPFLAVTNGAPSKLRVVITAAR